MANIGNLQDKSGDLLLPRALMYYTVLYENESGASTNITLNDSAANYTFIEVYIVQNDGVYGSTKIYNPDGKIINVTANLVAPTFLYCKNVKLTISGNTITYNLGSEARIGNSVATIYGTGTSVKIVRVIGYK